MISYHKRNINSKKKKLEEDPEEEDHEIKNRKEFETWEDVENLTRVTAPRENCRTRDKGSLEVFADVWQEIYEDDLEKENKRNFYDA